MRQLASMLEEGLWLWGLNVSSSSTLPMTPEALQALRHAIQVNPGVLACVIKDVPTPAPRSLQLHEDLVAMANELVNRDWPSFSMPTIVKGVLQSWKLRNQSLIQLVNNNGENQREPPNVQQPTESTTANTDTTTPDVSRNDSGKSITIHSNPGGTTAGNSKNALVVAPSLPIKKTSGQVRVLKTSVTKRPTKTAAVAGARGTTPPMSNKKPPTTTGTAILKKHVASPVRKAGKTMNVCIKNAIPAKDLPVAKKEGEREEEEEEEEEGQIEAQRLDFMEKNVSQLASQVAVMEEWVKTRRQNGEVESSQPSKLACGGGGLDTAQEELVRQITTQITRRLQELWA